MVKVSQVKEKYMFLWNLLIAVGLSFSLIIVLTGRETCCCGAMGKRNHTHLHLIWLSCSQNHLVPVFWDTPYVSVTAQGTVVRKIFGVLHCKLKPWGLVWGLCLTVYVLRWGRCNENTSGLQMAIPLQAPTVEVQREEYGAVEVESVLTVGPSSRRMTVECVAFNLVGVSSDTFAMEVSGACWMIWSSIVLFQDVITGSVLLCYCTVTWMVSTKPIQI